MLRPKTALIILYSVLALLVVALIAQIAIEGEFNGEIAARTLIPMAVCASSIVKVMTGGGRRIRNAAFFEKEYAHILRRAFAEQNRKRYRGKLIDALNYYNRDQYEKVLSICDSLLPHCATADDFSAVLTLKALAFTDGGLPQAAIDTYYEALRYDNTFSTAWSNLGVLFKGQGKNLDAVSCYRNAVKYDPNNETAYANLANVYFSIGYYGFCIENAKKALELKATLTPAMTALCGAYAAMGEDEEVDKYFKMAVQNGYDSEKLRAFIERVRDGMPAETLVPLDEAQQKSVRDIYTSTAIPTIRACLPAEADEKSRVGGRPFGDAPEGESGEKLHLLCAVFCSEVRGIPDFPEKGILQFFIADDENYGLDRQNPTLQKNFRVTYTEDEDTAENGDCSTEASEKFPIKKGEGLFFVPSMCAMTDNDFRFEAQARKSFAKFGAELGEDVMIEVRHRYHMEGHKIGGYPYFAGDDPRASRPELQKYDTLLLQIDTHDDFIEIGNTGVMNFFIARENLRKRDFSDVLYWWSEDGEA